MSSNSYELPLSHGGVKEEEKKNIRSSSKYYQNKPNSWQRRISQVISRHKTKFAILFGIIFLFQWLQDPSINEINNNSNSIKNSKKVANNPSGFNEDTLLKYGDLPSSVSSRKFSWKNPISWFWNPNPRIVIILAANDGGGVLRWKNEQEWSIERISINNKMAYAKRHGYALTLKDLTVSKRYSHEYREGWQKVDILKQTMREFPDAEWFWWLDLDTLIMEPDRSLEDHIFSRLDELVDRTLNHFNPLKIEVDIPYVDYTEQIDLLITQDCGGFNLGSFLIRNSDWSKLLLDIWFEPVAYEQKHMVWEHKEQDTLESLYASQAWVRSRVGFLPLRAINAFPPGACSEFSDDPRFFYNEGARDFVVNMAGCNFGRDCWGEMSHYTSLMEKFQSKWYSKLFS
ncbi:hypothetical protein Kpol_1031p65 [Vanderwaltozyma polyspora DSM 70294]|uniref:Alpha-1,6-mannosyltransferase MNN10 n=1 Tax=Vanderwaltozyma polyspora (strain ATCC 22028 / DSM 70294 / BCRC 21397 / CBS 2163 / NBRC 10782 / NRRL Y-8283 / UCD 57-17) TaxID=436907 RepID=A7THZ6_VANPO|nr:uncharacterized protein Kpol_1031p65 [Vanderwaltozyma polyspora DSM 70294]EDO18158.1 hypothetical protein Kpol_1031p65 [Vanderwaltozyma polyspora DSM 70294]